MIKIILLTIVLATTLSVSGVCGVTLRSGNVVSVSQDTPVSGDLLAAGRDISVQAKVSDVAAAGNTVDVMGPVAMSAMLAGNDVTVGGPVGNDLYAAGQNVRVDSSISDNAYLAGSLVRLARTGRVGSDLLAAGGTVDVLGNVGGDLRAAGETITIGGTVAGDVFASAGTSVRVLDGAVIRGDLNYESPKKAEISKGARVMGETRHRLPAKENAKPVFWTGAGLWFGLLLAAIVFGIVLALLFPSGVRLVADTIRRSFWPSLGIGALVLVAVPVVLVVLMITLVGIPLAIVLGLLYAIALYVAPILTGVALGQLLLNRRQPNAASLIWSVLLGVAVLAVIKLVPIVGWIVGLAALLVGLGSMLTTWWRGRREPAERTS